MRWCVSASLTSFWRTLRKKTIHFILFSHSFAINSFLVERKQAKSIILIQMQFMQATIFPLFMPFPLCLSIALTILLNDFNVTYSYVHMNFTLHTCTAHTAHTHYNNNEFYVYFYFRPIRKLCTQHHPDNNVAECWAPFQEEHKKTYVAKPKKKKKEKLEKHKLKCLWVN